MLFQVHLCHMIWFNSKTGPSLQTICIPEVVVIAQPRQAPTPQAITRSTEICMDLPCNTSGISAIVRYMGLGPQAHSWSAHVTSGGSKSVIIPFSPADPVLP